MKFVTQVETWLALNKPLCQLRHQNFGPSMRLLGESSLLLGEEMLGVSYLVAHQFLISHSKQSLIEPVYALMLRYPNSLIIPRVK